jgi:hypothetical protein
MTGAIASPKISSKKAPTVKELLLAITELIHSNQAKDWIILINKAIIKAMGNSKITTTIINRISSSIIINRAPHHFMHNNNSFSKEIIIKEWANHNRITITLQLDRKAQVRARLTRNKELEPLYPITILMQMMKVSI